MHVLQPGEEWTERPFPGKNIVRASHPNDFQGLVDVLATKVVPGTGRDIMNAIDHIRGEATSDLVMTYGKYENPSYDGKVTLAVQPHQKNSSDYRRGSIVEHPNRPDTYLINWVEDYGSHDRDVTSALYNAEGKRIQEFCYGKKDAAELVKMYQIIQRSEIVRDGLSFQLEFGEGMQIIGLPALYQIRAFTKRAVADFKIDERTDNPHGFVFGITPPEGITLPVYHDKFDEPGEPNEPYALFRGGHFWERNLENMPRNMSAYLPGSTFGSSGYPNLEHTHFWQAQKADVTVFEMGHDFAELLVNKDGKALDGLELGKSKNDQLRAGTLGVQERRVNIISDGRQARINILD